MTPTRIELIVVGNGSTDGSAELFRQAPAPASSTIGSSPASSARALRFGKVLRRSLRDEELLACGFPGAEELPAAVAREQMPG